MLNVYYRHAPTCRPSILSEEAHSGPLLLSNSAVNEASRSLFKKVYNLAKESKDKVLHQKKDYS